MEIMVQALEIVIGASKGGNVVANKPIVPRDGTFWIASGKVYGLVKVPWRGAGASGLRA
jgi:hypothetical protein